LKSTGDAVLGYSSPYWTNADLLNTDSAVEEEANAKYAAFNNVAFTTIRLCVGSPSTNCYEHTLSSEHSSAHSLFSGDFIRDTQIDQSRLLEVLGSPGIRTCAMQRPGFNIECTEGNKARFGFCVNKPSQQCQESDENDSDAALGFGLAGEADYLTGGESGEQGAGWTKFTHGTLAIQKNVWLWVDAPLPPTGSPSTSTYGSENFIAVDGCPRTGQAQTPAFAQSTTATANVRCCSLDGAHCATQDLASCSELTAKTFAEAKLICSTADKRLCTRQELEPNSCCTTGCNFDLALIWATQPIQPT